jgi:hypothetical protein
MLDANEMSAELVDVVREVSRFTSDRDQIIEAAVAHARRRGVDEEMFVAVIAEAVKALETGDRRVDIG